MQNRINRLRLTAIVAGLLAASSALAAQPMYKWVDEQGNVQYTQSPPRNAESQTIAPPPASPLSPEQAKKQLEEMQGTLKPEDPEAKKKAAEEKEVTDIARKNCETAKKNLALYNDPAARKFRRADGAVSIPTDQERRGMIEEAKKAMERYCDAPAADQNKPAGAK